MGKKGGDVHNLTKRFSVSLCPFCPLTGRNGCFQCVSLLPLRMA